MQNEKCKRQNVGTGRTRARNGEEQTEEGREEKDEVERGSDY